MKDLISNYIHYASESSEVPAVFHRWSIISAIGALLGRQYNLEFGDQVFNPNIYCMLLGVSGTRKSSAIKQVKRLLVQAGYNTIAASKTTKEKFLLDLAGESEDGTISPEELLDRNLFGESSNIAEYFIMADEFNDFFGNNILEFISLLGSLWDYEGIYEARFKNSKSVFINSPTISILGGNTPTMFASAFPTESLGQGFFSRILLIHGEPNGKRIAFPKKHSQEETEEIVQAIKAIKSRVAGAADFTKEAKECATKIYETNFRVDDVRFSAYTSRRFTHLLKLALITSAARESTTISEQDVIYANTILMHAERLMPKALGEFGKSKHSDVSNKIVQLAEDASTIITFKDIWRHVANDLDKMNDLGTLIQNLVQADKLQIVQGGAGYLPKKRVIEYESSTLFDMSLLTEEERNM